MGSFQPTQFVLIRAIRGKQPPFISYKVPISHPVTIKYRLRIDQA